MPYACYTAKRKNGDDNELEPNKGSKRSYSTNSRHLNGGSAQPEILNRNAFTIGTCLFFDNCGHHVASAVSTRFSNADRCWKAFL